MKPLKSLPEIIEEELKKLAKDITILEKAGIGGVYLSELKTKYASILWAIQKRDEQVKQALGWFEYYLHNRKQYMDDKPEERAIIDGMPKYEYVSYLIEKAFEGLKYENSNLH